VPTHIRALCSWQCDTALPRDAMTINPHFRHQGVLPGDDPTYATLANDLATGLNGWGTGSANRQLTVKLYDLADTEPRRPKATKVLNTGLASASSYPREVCLCLSFFGGNNLPQNRGRLYIPMWATGGSAGLRPDAAQRTKAGDLVPVLAGLGGVDIDWIVWSPTRNAATKVTNWFVDDEWDTQRRRGLRPTTRTAGTTGG
jgi:hypothetical protein